MAFKQNVNIPVLLAIGLVSVMLLLVLVLGTQAWFQADEQAEFEAKSVGAPKSEYVILKEQQADSLSRLGWTSPAKNAVMMPIERAMDLMVSTNGRLPSTQPATQAAQ